MNNISRRNLLLSSVAATAGALLFPGSVGAKEESVLRASALVTGQPKPLGYKSIPGFLSEEQLAPHHTAHYGGALRGYLAADEKLQTSILDATGIDSSAYGAIQRARTNKADSVILHELYFDGMTVNASQPSGELQASVKVASGQAILARHQPNGKL